METDDPQAPPTDTERVIGREMRRLRERLGITQQDVADRMTKNGFRLHQTQIAKMERGERAIRVNEWIGIASALGVTTQEMLISALASNEDESVRNLHTLAELEGQMELAERQLDEIREELHLAEQRHMSAKYAREAANAAAVEAEARERDLRVRYHHFQASVDFLQSQHAAITQERSRIERESMLKQLINTTGPAKSLPSGLVRDAVPIGTTLQAAREEAGMTVEEVSTLSELSPNVVVALEGTDYSKLTEPRKGDRQDGEDLGRRHLGMKAAISRYAVAVNLKPQPLLEMYEEIVQAREG
ncbi:helix-turn-helix domain-containing protein [Streptomyces sp. NPDC055210]